MLFAVQLNGQAAFGAVEVENIGTDRMLPAKLESIQLT
jgi:hypothetical protein